MESYEQVLFSPILYIRAEGFSMKGLFSRAVEWGLSIGRQGDTFKAGQRYPIRVPRPPIKLFVGEKNHKLLFWSLYLLFVQSTGLGYISRGFSCISPRLVPTTIRVYSWGID